MGAGFRLSNGKGIMHVRYSLLFLSFVIRCFITSPSYFYSFLYYFYSQLLRSPGTILGIGFVNGGGADGASDGEAGLYAGILIYI